MVCSIPVGEKLEEVMENAPVINFASTSPAPGAVPEEWDRYQKWLTEVYTPMFWMKIPGITRTDSYRIIHENPMYGLSLTIRHFDTFKEWEQSLKSPERIATSGDMEAWVKRRVREQIWTACYQLVKSFRSGPVLNDSKEDTKIENSTIMHIEAFHLRKEDEEKYNQWLNDYGFNSFIPLFVGLKGLKGYDFYRYTGFQGVYGGREWDYPLHISVLYFDTITNFENYEKSREFISYQKALRNVFPIGLNLRWYVQYQLVKSWRK
jgi:hypothetical protein